MGIQELRTFAISCDRCPLAGPVISASMKPSLPEGWTWSQVHDCGMTGYTRTEALCWNCTAQAERLADADIASSRNEGGT